MSRAALVLELFARDVAATVYGDFAAGRGEFADLVALFGTSELCRAAVTAVLAAELGSVSLLVYMVLDAV